MAGRRAAVHVKVMYKCQPVVIMAFREMSPSSHLSVIRAHRYASSLRILDQENGEDTDCTSRRANGDSVGGACELSRASRGRGRSACSSGWTIAKIGVSEQSFAYKVTS